MPLKCMRIGNCEHQEHDLKLKLNIFSILLFCIIPVKVVNAEESDNTVSNQTKRQQ